jgi:hypothetical protein
LSSDQANLSEGASDPRVRSAVRAIFSTAALFALLSLVGLLTQSTYLEKMSGFGWWTLATAVVLALLGFLVQRGSFPALAVAMGLLALQALWATSSAVSAEKPSPLWPIVLRMFLLVPMAGGLSALWPKAKK